jgi:hypothetical protein
MQIDFKKVHTKGYMAWRILSVNPKLSEVYQERVAKFKNYRSALIFPEQVIGLPNSSIYYVLSDKSNSEIKISIHTLTNPRIISTKDGSIDSIQDLVDWENLNGKPNDIKMANVITSYYARSEGFMTLPWFSNKSDAVKYASKCLEKF